MKRMIMIIMAAVMLCCTACQGKPDPAAEQADAPSSMEQTKTDRAPAETLPAEPEMLMEILDREGGHLGRIASESACTAADAGVFYSVFKPAENRPTAEAQYRFFRAADQKDILLGTLEDQCYEATYARTELGGIVYALAVTGNPYDDEADTLWLLALDPVNETMTKYVVSENGFPYAAMSAANGKLLIMNHEIIGTKCDKVYEFDPAAGTVREVLTYSEESGSLRSVYADEKGLYLLRLRLESGAPAGLVLDRYDREYQKLGELPLDDVMIPAALSISGISDEADARNEFGMMVSGFAVVDGRYLFYENFGMTRLLIDLEAKKALLAQSDLYSMIHGGAWGFHRVGLADEGAAEPEILILKNGKLEKTLFRMPDSRLMIWSVSRTPAGTWLALAFDGTESAARKGALILWSE